MLDSAVSQGLFSGGVLLVQRGHRQLHLSCHGRTAWRGGMSVTPATCFDLASLTKVLATTGLALLAAERGEIGLDAPLAEQLPVLGSGPWRRITPRHLLEHSSGLDAWRGYHAELAAFAGGAWVARRTGRDAVRRMVAAERPAAPPGRQSRYSDLGFILLDWLLERAGGVGLDRLFQRRLARPLELADLFFVDLKAPARAAAARRGRSFAATERCGWRGRVLCGEVHDDNTYAMGGVSGHAGLFGTAAAVGRLAAVWLDGWQGRPGPLAPDWVRRFWTRSAVAGSDRRLGFDGRSATGSQAGERMGPDSVGHLGFTGTSLWIDPDRALIAVLLTNRVHPRRADERIRDFRPRLHDALIERSDEEAR